MSQDLEVTFSTPLLLLGRIAEGIITICPKHVLTFTTLTVTYLCTQNDNNNNSLPRSSMKTIYQHTIVIKSSPQGVTVTGKQQYPFHFSIPMDLPPSIEVNKLCVEHRFIVVLNKLKSTGFSWSKKIEYSKVVEIVHPHFDNMTCWVKKYEFNTDEHQLIVNVDKEIVSLGDSMRINVLLTSAIGKDVALPLTINILQTFTTEKEAEVTSISKHVDHIRCSQPLAIDLVIPHNSYPSITSPITQVTITHILTISVNFQPISTKSVDGKIPLFITRMIQNRSRFMGEHYQVEEDIENYYDEIDAVFRELQLVADSLLSFKCNEDLLNRHPFITSSNSSETFAFTQQLVTFFLTKTKTPEIWKDSQTHRPSLTSIRNTIKTFQLLSNNTIAILSFIPPSSQRTEIFANMMALLSDFEVLLYVLYLKMDLSPVLEVKAEEVTWFNKLEEFKNWLGSVVTFLDDPTQIKQSNETEIDIEQLGREFGCKLYEFRVACDLISKELIPKVIPGFKHAIKQYFSVVSLMNIDSNTKTIVNEKLKNFIINVISYCELVQVLSFDCSLRKERYTLYGKCMFSILSTTAILLNKPQLNIHQFFNVYLCNFENDDMVVYDSHGIIVDNPSIYSDQKSIISEIIATNICAITEEYSSFLTTYSPNFLESTYLFSKLLLMSFLHPHAFRDITVEIGRPYVQYDIKELMTLELYQCDKTQDTSNITYDVCHSARVVVQQMVDNTRAVLLHGQFFSPIYQQLVEELKRLRKYIIGNVLVEFGKINEMKPTADTYEDSVKNAFFCSRQRHAIYSILFEENDDKEIERRETMVEELKDCKCVGGVMSL
ncbi:Uncharacterized protein QTN25_009053 [Entamoeba marina]